MTADRSLPEGWRWVRFGDVVRQVKQTAKDPESDGLTRIVGLDHLDSESLALRRWNELADLPDGTSFTRVFRAGQVLFGKRRAYQRKVAVADFDGVCSSDILVFEPSTDELLSDFLPYVVQSDGFFAHALGTSAGSLSPRTKWQELAKYGFALPSASDQRRIVEVLRSADRATEQYVCAVDAAATALEATAHEVAETSDDRPGWVTKVVDLVADGRPVTYGILKPGTGVADGIPVVKVKDYPEGKILEEELLLTSKEIDSQYERSRLRAGDLLISIRGTIGRVAEVPDSLDGANITQDTARLTIDPGHDRTYIRHMLETRDVQRQIKRRTTGLAVKGINIGALRQVEVPTPPIDTQRQLAQNFIEIDAVIERARRAAEACARAAVATREHLLNEVRDV